MVLELEKAQKKQEENLEGVAEEKDREETELEQEADLLAKALTLWFKSQKDETSRAKVDLATSSWQLLRDTQLLAKSQLVIDLASAVAAGAKKTEAEDYGITADAVAALTKERKDYDDIVNAPDVAVGVRKALSKGLRPAFALVEDKFEELDGLILQFGRSPEGRAMIQLWKDARKRKGADAEEAAKKTAGGVTAPAPAPGQ